MTRATPETFTCFCSERAARPVLQGPAFRIVRCRRCGACRTDPPPLEQPAEVVQIIEGHQRHPEHFRAILSDVLAEVLRFRSGGRFLDVGCSVGHLLSLAAERGFDVHGIELQPLAVRYARERFGDRIVDRPIEDSPFEPASFAVITLNHVLEHHPNPVGFLGQVRRLLRPDGVLVVGVPNFGGWACRLEGIGWYGLQPFGHVWQYTPQSLADCLRRADLRPRRIRTRQLHRTWKRRWKHRVRKLLYDSFERLGRGDSLLVTASPESPSR